MTWFKALSWPRLQREQRCVTLFQGREILLLLHRQQVYALENTCPHQGFPLENGCLDPEAQTLSCPHHLWRFRLSDGQCTKGQARLKTYATQVKNGQVWVADLHSDPLDVLKYEDTD